MGDSCNFGNHRLSVVVCVGALVREIGKSRIRWIFSITLKRRIRKFREFTSKVIRTRTSITSGRKFGNSGNRNITLRTRWRTYGPQGRPWGRIDPENRQIAVYMGLFYNSKKRRIRKIREISATRKCSRTSKTHGQKIGNARNRNIALRNTRRVYGPRSKKVRNFGNPGFSAGGSAGMREIGKLWITGS